MSMIDYDHRQISEPTSTIFKYLNSYQLSEKVQGALIKYGAWKK